jgi:hypothetical protein
VRNYAIVQLDLHQHFCRGQALQQWLPIGRMHRQGSVSSTVNWHPLDARSSVRLWYESVHYCCAFRSCHFLDDSYSAFLDFSGSSWRFIGDVLPYRQLIQISWNDMPLSMARVRLSAFYVGILRNCTILHHLSQGPPVLRLTCFDGNLWSSSASSAIRMQSSTCASH